MTEPHRFTTGEKVVWSSNSDRQRQIKILEFVRKYGAGPFELIAVRDVRCSCGQPTKHAASNGHLQFVTVISTGELENGNRFELSGALFAPYSPQA